jgi:hypothetical protein
MICPKCRAEYREGFSTCADCGIPLVEDLAEVAAGARPGDSGSEEEDAGPEPGTPEGLVPLGEVGDPELLSAVLERLEEAQIPYVVQAGTALALVIGRDLEHPGHPDLWSARVLVVGAFRREAWAMVQEVVGDAREKALDARARPSSVLDR